MGVALSSLGARWYGTPLRLEQSAGNQPPPLVREWRLAAHGFDAMRWEFLKDLDKSLGNLRCHLRDILHMIHVYENYASTAVREGWD